MTIGNTQKASGMQNPDVVLHGGDSDGLIIKVKTATTMTCRGPVGGELYERTEDRDFNGRSIYKLVKH